MKIQYCPREKLNCAICHDLGYGCIAVRSKFPKSVCVLDDERSELEEKEEGWERVSVI